MKFVLLLLAVCAADAFLLAPAPCTARAVAHTAPAVAMVATNNDETPLQSMSRQNLATAMKNMWSGAMRKRDFVQSRIVRHFGPTSKFMRANTVDECLLDAEGGQAAEDCYRQ